MWRRLAIALSLVALVGCRSKNTWQRDELPYDQIVVAPERVSLQSGRVGAGRWETDATFVLAAARNSSDRDADVSLAGDLITADGTRYPLHVESLRVPGGGERTFALVDKEQKARPDAVRAEVRVTGAMLPDYPPPVAVTDGAVHQDQGRAVVAGNVVNTAARECQVSVMAAFYDAAGVPLQRPFTVFKLGPNGKRGTQFVGPPGSVSAQLYVGEVNY
jgi:hypothetical protein